MSASDGQSQLNEHPGVQLAVSQLLRSTTQTAIVLGAGMGWEPPAVPALGNPSSAGESPESEKRFRWHAANEMLGVLRASLNSMPIFKIGLIDEQFSENTCSKFKRDNRQHPDPQLSEATSFIRSRSELAVDLVLTPIDGATSLSKGASGSVSVAAAGEPGCFVENPDKKCPTYLTIAIPRHSMQKNGVREYLGTLKNTYDGKSVEEVLQDYKSLEKIVKMMRAPGVPPVIAVTLKPSRRAKAKPCGEHTKSSRETPSRKDKNFLLKMKTWHTQRVLDGSVVATGLAAFCEKVDCSLFISRWPQLIQIAIAAKSLGGEIVALPLKKDRGVTRIASGNLLQKANILKEGKKAILCATSISEVCVLDRVRFHRNGTATTDSIIVSSATGRVTRQVDTFILKTAHARDPAGMDDTMLGRIAKLWQAGSSETKDADGTTTRKDVASNSTM
jgi:hypothetical protein